MKTNKFLVQHSTDEHFHEFISSLAPILAEHGENTEELQCYQITRLVELEKLFRMILVRHKYGPDTYKAFINHILNVKHNILMARPYFRERDTTFKAFISPVLKEKDHLSLYQFAINNQFISFVLNQRDWSKTKLGCKLLLLAKDIKNIRRDLAECNMPLAISQARAFSRRNSRSHMGYMDMNQTCFVGLLEGIDKYVGPYHRRFRAVLIGRMIGNLIESNSETFIHFYPPDKRRIYRARKIIGKTRSGGPVDIDEVCNSLNNIETTDNNIREQERLDQEFIDGIKRKSKYDSMTTVGDLFSLLAAAYVIPSSSLESGTDHTSENADLGINPIERYPDKKEARPDVMVEEVEARKAVSAAILKLSLIDRKLLTMKGISEL